MKHPVKITQLIAVALLAVATSSCATTYSGSSGARAEQDAPTEFRVRVGLYARSGLAIARKVEDTLKEDGHAAYIRRINSNTHGLYVGRNLDKDKADALKRRIDRLLDTKTLVVSM